MHLPSWRLLLRATAIVLWVVSIVWLGVAIISFYKERDLATAYNFLGALVPLLGAIVTSIASREQSRRPSITPNKRNRCRLLEKVRRFWVEGVLENSLHGAALIDLGLIYQPEAVEHPWAVVVQDANGAHCTLAPGTKIREVFQTAHGELLILGAPGSGKTTLLLELARDLLATAEQDEAQPMPVVFNLSSWATRCHPLVEWLIDELNERYDVPRTIGQAWIEADEILPLLDGLDEVQQEHRVACVDAINAFRRDHGMVGLVVCSRQADYEMLQVRLKLGAAVLIQPLTPEQIDVYLARAGDQLAALRTALTSDAELQELAQSPLMLSIMTLAYRGASASSLLLSGTIDERRRHLFAAYVERMFQRRGRDRRYTREQTLHWLNWLASAMSKQAQSVFLIERLQPEWLPTPNARRLYTLVDRLGGGLSLGLFVEPVSGLVEALVFGLVMGLVVGLVFGGYACLSHLALRFVLWRCGAMPWNIVRFLDYCSERIFLRKVGGGYIFVHRLLLEYFATLHTQQKALLAHEQTADTPVVG